jgi:hypothetical protein
MAFPIIVLNRLRYGLLTAAEVASSTPERRAWICITPLPDEPYETIKRYLENRSFQVMRFEVDIEFVSRDYCLPDEAIHEIETIEISNENELEKYVIEYVNELSDLTSLWKCEMPS